MSLQDRFGYARLTDQEITDIVIDIDQLLEWMHAHQLREQDFFRAAIIDGLILLRFRLVRLRWLGWSYTLVGLRDVIQAYLALSGSIVDQNQRPDGGAVLLKLSSFVSRIWKVARFAKEATETSTFMVEAYGKLTEVSRSNPGIAGLNSSASNDG